MKKELINNTNLQRLIALKANKFDYEEVTDEDIEKISEIVIHGKLINGQSSGIDLNECVGLFENLNFLGVSDFILTPEIIKQIESLKKLTSLEIISCEFIDTDFSPIFGKVKTKFIGCRELPFVIQNQRVIDIQGCEVDFKKLDLKDAEELKIISCNIKNARNLEDEKLTRVNLDGSILTDENGEPIPNIKVPQGCSYSHLEDITEKIDGPIDHN